MSITPNAINRIVNLNEGDNNQSFQPIVQILKVIPVTSGPGGSEQKKRYRIILSDGEQYCQGMLGTQHNHFVENNQVTDFTLIKINDSMKNVITNRALVIILGFDIVSQPAQKIGLPQDIGEVKTNDGPNKENSHNGGRRIKPDMSNRNNNNPMNGHNPYSSSAPIVRTNPTPSSSSITPIASLNLYQNRWTIKARLTSKSQIRHWSNAKGEGSLFSVELLDSSMDIRATFFRDAVDKFHDMLEPNKVYTLSGGKMKTANMQYNTCKSSYELTFDANAEIHLADDTGEIVQLQIDVVPISSLESVEPGKMVDIMGVVKSVGEPGTIVSKKSGKELNKCELTVTDDSGAEVSCTVWGERAMTAPQDFAGQPVVAFKRARVSDYGGRTLSASDGGIFIRPDRAEAQRIQNWWQSGGSSGAAKSLSSSGGGGAGRFPNFTERKSVSSIKGENLGYNNEKPDYVSYKGTFSFIKSDRDGGAWYEACPNADEPCKNRYKVTQGSDGTFTCDRCNQRYPNCMHRYIFSATISDDTSTTWVSLFDDQAKILLNGMTADEMHSILNGEGGQDAYDGCFQKAMFTDWIVTCKVKLETHQEEARAKTTIQSLHPMDYAKEGRSLLDSILAM